MPASPPYRSKWDEPSADDSRRRSVRPESSRSSGGNDFRSAGGKDREDRRYPREERASYSNREVYGNGADENRRRSNGRSEGTSYHGSRSSKRRSRSRSPRPSTSSTSARPDFTADRARERRAYESNANARSRQASGSAPRGAPSEEEPPVVEEEAVNFEPSGLLAKESNQKDGVALKYHEPPEARKPRLKWRLYIFKDGKEEELLHISRQSCYLLGRDRTVVDIPLDHPSCSKQHAAIQFRQIVERNEFGDEKRSIRPFVIDLDSANGTYVNKDEVPTSRFYELKNGDTMAFGASTREYVLLCEDEG